MDIIRWNAVARVATALADTAVGDPIDIAEPLTRALDGLLAPHYSLQRLNALTEPVLQGDRHAAAQLRDLVNDLASRASSAVDLTDKVVSQRRSDCPCGDCAESSADPQDATLNVTAPAAIDQAAFVRLALAVATVFACEPEADRFRSISAVVGLSLMAKTLDRLLIDLDRSGPQGVAETMAILGGFRAASIVPPPMRTLSGGPGGPIGPAGPLGPVGPKGPGGLGPGGPKGPGDPIGPPKGGLPEFLKDHIKDKIDGRAPWDPETWDHIPIDIFVPGHLDDRRVACEVQLTMALQARKEPPPVRPIRPVWSDGIASIDAPNPCAGNVVVIHGAGFGEPKPAGVVLMVPIEGSCTPFEVAPDDWHDTEIRFTLPANVTSGPIGFGDLAYITAYNAWVDRINAATAAAIGAKCGGPLRQSLLILRHFFECPPPTPFNRLRAGKAMIRSFTVNGGALAVAVPGDPLTLAWDVVNAEISHIDRTSTNGPLLAGSTTLVNPAPFAKLPLGPAAHGGPDRFRYVLTADGPCGGATAVVEVVATKAPGLSVADVEITQSIQTKDRNVRFVAQKPTVVRVTVRHSLNGWGDNTVPGVVGRIKFQVLGNPWSKWYDAVNGSKPIAPVPGASITVPGNPQRANTNDTLNFLIPPAYCTGEMIAQVEVRVAGFDASPGFPGWSQQVLAGTGYGFITFEKRRMLNMRYVRVRWQGVTPSDDVCQASLQAALPLLPTPMAVIQPLPNTPVMEGVENTLQRRDNLLDDFNDRHNCSAWEMATEFLGSDCPDEDDTIWVLIAGAFVRGKAHDIPGNVCFTPPSDGPYAAHELSHCLNQQHLGVACPPPNGQNAGGDDPSKWPNGGALADVPFDTSSNTTVAGSGTVWDVMTYCGTPTSTFSNTTWTSPQRWQWLWDYNGV